MSRLAALATVAVAGTAAAQPAGPPAPVPEAQDLPPLVVVGRETDLLEVAATSSEGRVGRLQLESRPLLRQGEVLETIPGFIATQHSGAGKANQYFLRGFNLDHGTDFATTVNGVPQNLRSHGHGQGYTDVQFLIPELIESVTWRKGPYFADLGDFASAGAADIQYVDALPSGIAHAEGGYFGHVRGLLADSFQAGPGTVLVGGDFIHADGPWDHPDGFNRGSGVLRYSQGDADRGWRVTAMGYGADWDATDQVARRAVNRGVIGRLGSLDTTTGGETYRAMLSGDWHRRDAASATRLGGYAAWYDFTLYSNFTYFLTDPVLGDQFEQQDERWYGGVDAEHTLFGELAGREMENTFGLQARQDAVHNGLFNTSARLRTDKTDRDGNAYPAITREDRLEQFSVGGWWRNRARWTDWFRTEVGVRGDWFTFDVNNRAGADSGDEGDFIASPKASLIFGPWARTELYVNGGLGFHSNDARGVTAAEDAADPLVRSEGAEVGVRTLAVPGLQSTLTAWILDLDSELVFVGDAGATEASRPSRRYGLEFANYYSPRPWITLDADLAVTHAEFTDDAPEGNDIPGAPEWVVAAGVSLRQPGERGFFGSFRVRHLGERPLVEDGSVKSSATTLLSAQVGYRVNARLTLLLEAFNLLDADESDIEYWYPSLLAGESPGPDDGGYHDLHFHPAEPFALRGAVTYRF